MHYEFFLSVATAWIDRDEVTPRELKRRRNRKEKDEARAMTSPLRTARSQRKSPPQAAACPTPSPMGSKPSPKPSPQKAPRINEKTLDPDKGSLQCRLNHYDLSHCPDPVLPKACCGLHRYLNGRANGSEGQCRDKILNCSVCKVNLCVPCFRSFHTERDIGG